MRRREFITLIGCAVTAWPPLAHAQQSMRRVGALMDTEESNPVGQARVAALRQGMQQLGGWVEGRNIQLQLRWSGGDAERARAYAAELVGLSPDVIFAYAKAQLAPLAQVTRTIPLVFVGASDPVGDGYVASFSRPGGNITGFTLFEPSIAGKWLGVLKEIAPAVTRVTLMVNPDTAPLRGTFYVTALATAAATFKVESRTAFVRSVADIEATMEALGRAPHSSLIVASDTFTNAHSQLIVALAGQHRVPAIYPFRFFTTYGGLVAYGPDEVDACRRSAAYIDRILKGEKPAELPVQAPVKFEFVINLKTAKTLGLDVPLLLQQRADELIE